MAVGWQYLFCNVVGEIGIVTSLLHTPVKKDVWFVALGFTLLVLLQGPDPCHGQYAYQRRQSPREENGGLAFLMDNWLFDQSAPSSTPTDAEETLTKSEENVIPEVYTPADVTNEVDVPVTFLETNWNEPVSLTHREKSELYDVDLETTVEALKSSEKQISSGPTSSTYKTSASTSPISRTKATVASIATSGEAKSSSSPEVVSPSRPEVPFSPGRNRTLSRRRDGRLTSSGTASTTTEEKPRGPVEGDVKLEGGDVEGTGNVLVFRYAFHTNKNLSVAPMAPCVFLTRTRT